MMCPPVVLHDKDGVGEMKKLQWLSILIGLSLATVETIDATPEQFRTMAETAGTLPEPLRASELLGDSLRLDDWQQLLVREALRRAEGRVPDAAEALGISRATLYRKLDQYGLSREEFSRDTPDDSADDGLSGDGP